MHDEFTCVFSIPVKFEIYFLGSLVLLQITNYIYSS